MTSATVYFFFYKHTTTYYYATTMNSDHFELTVPQAVFPVLAMNYMF